MEELVFGTFGKFDAALDDVVILHQLFTLIIDDLTYEDVYRLIYLGDNTIRQMPFGKHRGEALVKLPKTYLSWLAGSCPLLRPQITPPDTHKFKRAPTTSTGYISSK